MKITFGRGSSEVSLDSDYSDMVERVLRQSIPLTLDVLDAELTDIANEARASWPVGRERYGRERGRPHSRDLIETAVRVQDADTIDGIVRNNAAYAVLIKSEKNGLNGGSPFQILIRRPLKLADREIANTLATDLANLINGFTLGEVHRAARNRPMPGI